MPRAEKLSKSKDLFDQVRKIFSQPRDNPKQELETLARGSKNPLLSKYVKKYIDVLFLWTRDPDVPQNIVDLERYYKDVKSRLGQ